MFGLPMEIVGPVLGIGSIIAFVVAGIVIVRFAGSRLSPRVPRDLDQSARDQLLEDLQARVEELGHLTQRVGELEERVDFAERLLAMQREAPRLGQG
jgi:hypothetical protein